MQKRKYLLRVRMSRKSYLLIYLMVLVVLGTLFYLNRQGFELSGFGFGIPIIFAILAIQITEIYRLKDWWGVTDSALVQSTGIFNKNVREVDFSSISDLDLNQPFFKRIINYGDVNVRLFLNETSIRIRGINKPQKFVENLQEIMHEKKSKGGITNELRKV